MLAVEQAAHKDSMLLVLPIMVAMEFQVAVVVETLLQLELQQVVMVAMVLSVAVVVVSFKAQEFAQVEMVAMVSTLQLVQFLLVAQVRLVQIPMARQVVVQE
jgi:hypothetical protein